MVTRLLPDGRPDVTFADDGTFVLNDGDTYAWATDVAVQPDGKIIVAVAARSEQSSVDLIRLTSGGALDPTFGTGGIVSGPRGLTVNTQLWDLALQADGKLLLAGNTAIVLGEDVDMRILRYLANGTPDPDFGTAGDVFSGWISRPTISSATTSLIAVLADGRIVVGGLSLTPQSGGFAFARLTPGGTLDSTFGGTGRIVGTGPDLAASHAFDLTVTPDGKVVAVGYRGFPEEEFVVAQFTATGALDNTFGSFGFSPVRFPGRALSVVRDARGRIIVGGLRDTGDSIDFVVVRLLRSRWSRGAAWSAPRPTAPCRCTPYSP